MIGHLYGQITEITEKEILIQTSSGVGYSVFPAGSLLSQCKKGKNIAANILTIVRETEISLYGFGHKDEKTLFQKLLNISGIGPKMALQIVSTPIDIFLSAVENGEVNILTKIPGLGKKTAERLIIELRGKLDLSSGENAIIQKSKAFEEAIDALENLGYDKSTIEKILKQAPENYNTENYVKYFLSSNA